MRFERKDDFGTVSDEQILLEEKENRNKSDRWQGMYIFCS